ncbi:hypothetical protein KAI87_05810 [Myxococcota bacterium]|nr:hypothetical protein [Myxococcota bacterium]
MAFNLISLLIFALFALTACGGPCGSEDGSDSADAPRIIRFDTIDPGFSDDPWTIYFSVDFEDKDGDLAAGEVRYFISDEDKPSVTQDCEGIFRQADLSFDTRSGEFWTSLTFDQSIKDGSKADLQLQLRDGAGHLSNCYTLELQFNVQSSAIKTITSRKIQKCVKG